MWVPIALCAQESEHSHSEEPPVNTNTPNGSIKESERPRTVQSSAKPLKKALTYPWKISGQELLIEVVDYKGAFKSGVYACDTSKAGNSSTSNAAPLRLLIAEGQKPYWSPRYKRFAYSFRGDLCLADTKGNVAAISRALPVAESNPLDPPLFWGWSGNIYNVRRSQEWGSTAYITHGNYENLPIEKLTYSFIWERTREPIVPLAKPQNTNVVKRDTRWADFQNTNNPSFSPSGTSMAAEEYPATPWDLQRKQSKIKVYDFFKWSGRSELTQKDKEQMQQSQKWFYSNAIIAPIKAPGRRLTSLPSNMIELNPQWSPKGDWIAFTLVDPAGSMSPVVVRANGKELTRLPITYMGNPKITPYATAPKSWGATQGRVIQWARDGKYLWLSGGAQNSIQVAKRKANKWVVESVVDVYGTLTKIKFMSFHGPWVAYIEGADPENTNTIHLVNVETKERRQLTIPLTMQVVWMSW